MLVHLLFFAAGGINNLFAAHFVFRDTMKTAEKIFAVLVRF